jgi:hypothetical protein
MLLAGVGAGIDLARAYTARQRLSETAILACQYASRSSIINTSTSSYTGTGGGTAYASKVTAFINAQLIQQHFQWVQTNATPFSYTPGGAANVTLSAAVPTTFMELVQINQISVSATSHCYDNVNSINTPIANGTAATVVQESFENSACSGTCVTYYATNGTIGTTATPVNTFSSTVGYTGTTGTKWYIMGYCLEVDTVGLVESTVADGTHSAELDCDNGQGTAGNSSISTQVYLAAGNYELRYNFAARVDYPDYDPVYLAASSASDLTWATDTNAKGLPANTLRTNQINAYLDLNASGVPPTHTTIDGSQTLGGSNLIDMSLYSSGWIERSVRIKVTTSGYYWLSFAADGTNDSFGGQLDNIRLCQGSCTTTLQDNFPSPWLAANNGGVNKVLFEDTFETPVRSPAYPGANFNTTSTLDQSYGTSGTTASGWPNLAASGWSTTPYDQIDYYLSGSAQGNQSIELDADLNVGQTTSNRTISRPFLLDPGYYQINYDYVSNLQFSGQTTTLCNAAPSASTLLYYNAYAALFGPGTNRMSGTVYTGFYDSNYIGVFVSSGQLVSTPSSISIGLNVTASFANPNGTTTATASVALDFLNLASYNSSQYNQLVDICGFATSWQTRTTYIQIIKPGYYWLSIAALGHADDQGGEVDDVKLTAMGSLYASSPPTNAVTIPVPAPQPGSSTIYTGFYIVADPLVPPAVTQ